jgi:hypothetical protein
LSQPRKIEAGRGLVSVAPGSKPFHTAKRTDLVCAVDLPIDRPKAWRKLGASANAPRHPSMYVAVEFACCIGSLNTSAKGRSRRDQTKTPFPRFRSLLGLILDARSVISGRLLSR